MVETFSDGLDALISKHKELGAAFGEMIADMRGAIDGLDAEMQEADSE